MTFPKQPQPYEHGSTVLPGVPLPASAHPHPEAPPQAPPMTPSGSASDPAPESPAEEQSPAAERPVKTPWWKKKVGGSQQVEPAAEVDEAPAPAPPAPMPLPPPVVAASDVPAPAAPAPAAPAPTPADEAVVAPVSGRHAAASTQQPEPTPGRNRLVLLAVVGLAVVLAAVAAFVWPGFLMSSDDSGAAPAPSPPASVAVITLTTPAMIDGMRRFTGAADKKLAASVAQGAVDDLTDPVSAVYGKGTTPTLQVIAWRAVSPPAADTVTAAFTGYEGSTGAKVTELREVATPGLSGHMECGLVTVSTAKTLQCFWADEFSVGSVTVFSPKSQEAATVTATDVRVAVETKT